ncbi:hypothetical protein POTOM_047498 [Populus tomentosa]|uniref:Nucleobase-ascorbate transporter 11 n=1 Tax=Populus tomentosa TaxID=118781 RepID=A0A8X7YM55_POPTO|nr:hypothetical protein POTOM_047498 [Populus tomentosa]
MVTRLITVLELCLCHCDDPCGRFIKQMNGRFDSGLAKPDRFSRLSNSHGLPVSGVMVVDAAERNFETINLVFLHEKNGKAVPIDNEAVPYCQSLLKNLIRVQSSRPEFRSEGLVSAEALILGFQHYLLTLGITVMIPSIIVPRMGGGDAEKARVIQTLLFTSGLSTLFQTLFGTRLPSVAVGSYAYMIPTTSIVLASRHTSCLDNNVYLPRYVQSKRPICDRFAVLFTAAITWLFAQILTASTVYNDKSEITQMTCRTDRVGLIHASPWIYIPYPFQWGSPTFKAGEVFAMTAASLVSLFESTGTFYATSRYGSATPVPPSVVSRGVGWLGIGVLLNGRGYVLFDPPPLFFYFCVSRDAWLIDVLVQENLEHSSHLYLCRSLLLCIVFCLVIPFHDIVTVIFMSHTTVAALVALFLDCTLAKENDETTNDTGLKWWEKFSLYSSDVRNDEFYALPCKLNKLFPAL